MRGQLALSAHPIGQSARHHPRKEARIWPLSRHPITTSLIALTSFAATMVGHGVVFVASHGGAPAAREGAGPVADFDQVPQPRRELIATGLPLVLALGERRPVGLDNARPAAGGGAALPLGRAGRSR